MPVWWIAMCLRYFSFSFVLFPCIKSICRIWKDASPVPNKPCFTLVLQETNSLLLFHCILCFVVLVSHSASIPLGPLLNNLLRSVVMCTRAPLSSESFELMLLLDIFLYSRNTFGYIRLCNSCQHWYQFWLHFATECNYLPNYQGSMADNGAVEQVWLF